MGQVTLPGRGAGGIDLNFPPEIELVQVSQYSKRIENGAPCIFFSIDLVNPSSDNWIFNQSSIVSFWKGESRKSGNELTHEVIVVVDNVAIRGNRATSEGYYIGSWAGYTATGAGAYQQTSTAYVDRESGQARINGSTGWEFLSAFIVSGPKYGGT